MRIPASTRGRLDPGGAELELGDLAERVQRRVGQEVRRRLGVAERDEDDPARHVAVDPALEFDCPAAGGHPDRVTGAQPHLGEVVGREMGYRLGLDAVQHLRPPCHRAGMPMLEHAPGGEDHRKILVRHLVRRRDRGRNELAATARGREAIAENHVLARPVDRLDRVGHRTLALEPFPGDALDRGHDLAHLREHICRPAVAPVEAEPAGDLLDDPQILARVSRRLQGDAGELHLTVGVGKRAFLLREGRCWQHHIGVVGSLGQEQILDHQMLEPAQRRAGVVDIGVRHRRVLAHDVHAADLARMDGIHDLDHGQPALGIELGVPEGLEGFAHVRARDRLVVGVKHRDQPGIGCSLDVVLPAQGVQARA